MALFRIPFFKLRCCKSLQSTLIELIQIDYLIGVHPKQGGDVCGVWLEFLKCRHGKGPGGWLRAAGTALSGARLSWPRTPPVVVLAAMYY